jgi:probable F420-dependent oxidoreductase, MSMEG_2256 family
MTVAVAANDVHVASGGRLRLGLGTQVRAHVERRFGMPWSRPAARMEEFLAALRAIWDSWQTGNALRFEGEFYRHTLMTEFFDPGPNPHGPPPVLLAAVGEKMVALAGRMSDGLLCHAFITPSYLGEVTVPTVRRARGGDLTGFSVGLPAFVVLGADEAERSRAEYGVRRQLAFYASTPSYRPVLDHHGWGALADRLTPLSRAQAWEEMAAAIDDDVLAAFAVAGTPEEVAAGVRARFGELADRITLYTPYQANPDLVRETALRIRKA